MARRSIVSINQLSEYLRGVKERADHHAKNVNSVILALLGAVILFKDADDIEILTNVIWVRIKGTRYAFRYNYDEETVEIRRDSLQGPVAASFDNTSTPRHIYRIFNDL